MREVKTLLKLANELRKTIGTVESITGGALTAALTSVSGASKVIKGGLVTYTNEEKEKLLTISRTLLEKHGAISEAAAHEMAKLGRYRLNVDLCVALTGNAGPTAIENKPIGLFYLAIATPHEVCVKKFMVSGTRTQIRRQAVNAALLEIIHALKIGC
jgi:nicotinamide-nucleotide amidase